MPPKRKLADVEPEPAVPPSLPPSVEEAYRRKCVQLKNRTNEVEEANDAARLRLARLKRQVEKLRIERAFLLEQLSRRTSANVEDSEGSPSPPPTVRDGAGKLFAAGNRDMTNLARAKKPKEKPLRIKRGHRKAAALLDIDAKATPGGSVKEVASPGSDANATGGASKRSKSRAGGASTNGSAKAAKPPASAYELYCADARPILEAKNEGGEGDLNIEEELKQGWEDMPEADKDEILAKFEEISKKLDDKDDADEMDDDEDDDEDDDDVKDKEDKSGDADEGDDNKADGDAQDEDVEMTNYDTEDQETQMDKDGDD